MDYLKKALVCAAMAVSVTAPMACSSSGSGGVTEVTPGCFYDNHKNLVTSKSNFNCAQQPCVYDDNRVLVKSKSGKDCFGRVAKPIS